MGAAHERAGHRGTAMTRNSLTVLLTLLLVAATGLTACGRKGPLERPPATTTSTAAPDKPAPDATVRGPNRPFVLDRLLR